MKKLLFRIISLILVVSLISAPATVFAADSTEDAVQPCYTNITSIAAAISIDSYGKASCSGSAVLTYSSDTGKIIMYLQQKQGSGWYNLYSWTDTEKPLYLSNSRYVYSGYYYRVRTVLTVYDSAGNVVDAGQAVSQTVYYG